MFWLAITFCLLASPGECEMRTVPQEFPSFPACQYAAASLVRALPGEYRLPFLCATKRPAFPMIPATVAPGKWA